jgi:hypothetical protein
MLHTCTFPWSSTNRRQRQDLDYIIGGGNVVLCNGYNDNNCHAVYNGDEENNITPSAATDEPQYKALLNRAIKAIPKAKLKFPNGLARGADGLFYVPSVVDGNIRVLELNGQGEKMRLIDTISVGMPLDNLSPDANGDIYAPGFPNIYQTAKGFGDPANEIAPVTIWRIRKVIEKGAEGVQKVNYQVTKILEDKDSKVLSGSTTVRHDAKTGRLFIGGEFLCEGNDPCRVLTCSSLRASISSGLRTTTSANTVIEFGLAKCFSHGMYKRGLSVIIVRNADKLA